MEHEQQRADRDLSAKQRLNQSQPSVCATSRTSPYFAFKREYGIVDAHYETIDSLEALVWLSTMTGSKRITIHDIARKAGVSPSTVSRVLNSTTPVAEAKRQAVTTAIQQLDYRPNLIAQGLARGTSTIIGVLTQDIGSPFYGELLRGIEYGFRGSRYHPIFADGNWQQAEEYNALNILRSRQPEALIILGGLMPDAEMLAAAQEFPLIIIGRSVPSLEEYCVLVDNFQGAYRATQYLIEMGHQRIAHITGIRSHQDTLDRQAGYEQALRDANLPINPDLIVEGTFQEQSGLLAVETLLMRANPFTALFAANDQMAYGARLALYRRGIRVPEDVSLIGFDDLPSSAYTTPPLTTVRQPTFEMGMSAAKATLNLIDQRPWPLPQLTPDLVIRESTGFARR